MTDLPRYENRILWYAHKSVEWEPGKLVLILDGEPPGGVSGVAIGLCVDPCDDYNLCRLLDEGRHIVSYGRIIQKVDSEFMVACRVWSNA